MRNLLVLFAIFNLILSCSRAPKLQASSYVRYLAEEQQLDAEFKVADSKTPTIFQKVEDVFFIDGAMERDENKIQGIFYHAEKDGALPKAMLYRFKYEKNDYEAQFAAASLLNLSIKDSTAHKINGLTLSWEGLPLDKDEFLTVMISDADEVMAEAKIKGATASSVVSIPGAMFSGLKKGKGKVYVIRTSLKTVENDKLLLEATNDFYSKTVNVNIVE